VQTQHHIAKSGMSEFRDDAGVPFALIYDVNKSCKCDVIHDFVINQTSWCATLVCLVLALLFVVDSRFLSCRCKSWCATILMGVRS
jgi:hypothetical protein